MEVISASITELSIKEHIMDGYNIHDERLPSGICVTCRSWLVKRVMGSSYQPSLPLFDHSSLYDQNIIVTRSRPESASCFAQCVLFNQQADEQSLLFQL